MGLLDELRRYLCGDKRSLRHLLYHVIQNQEKMMTTQADLVKQLNTIGDNLKKVAAETSTLLQKITDLQNAVPPDATPELVAAVQAVADQAKAVDDLVPDAPTPTLTPTPAP
jgi:ABC-type transporter Mla subunit MlaD